MSDYSETIQHVDTATGIRLRLEHYVGPPSSPETVNTLLTESVCLALDNVAAGESSNVAISLHEDGSASVLEDSPGIRVDKHKELIESILTEVFACKKHKRDPLAKDVCQFGIVLTNALSEWFTYETAQDGWIWKIEFVRGLRQRPLEKTEPCTNTWRRISFRPDRDIFAEVGLSSSVFRKWFCEQRLNLGSSTVTLVDRGQVETLHPQN